MEKIPRWCFTFRVQDSELMSAFALELMKAFDPVVTELTAVFRGDLVRVTVSHDSYAAAYAIALGELTA
jgi:hypothetical protein